MHETYIQMAITIFTQNIRAPSRKRIHCHGRQLCRNGVCHPPKSERICSRTKQMLSFWSRFLFIRGLMSRKANRKSQKNVSLVTNVRKFTKGIMSPYYILVAVSKKSWMSEKYCSHWWDTAFCGVWSVPALNAQIRSSQYLAYNGKYNTVFTLNIGTPYLLTILVL